MAPAQPSQFDNLEQVRSAAFRSSLVRECQKLKEGIEFDLHFWEDGDFQDDDQTKPIRIRRCRERLDATGAVVAASVSDAAGDDAAAGANVWLVLDWYSDYETREYFYRCGDRTIRHFRPAGKTDRILRLEDVEERLQVLEERSGPLGEAEARPDGGGGAGAPPPGGTVGGE
eukprot:CAMPEP_0179217494 /NCGR_PEP_ID=MMETSP0797-20121207/3951_1 /TAXON_ID=47934 /ORGANISM="Dinophysis acuminata, Strain DAEP01" /LENGTH=171 /DNA_ID=CAMNT_0020923741 /DNA_START=440 /DNA_END=952 /DNA_ORIENTATION=+